MAFHSVRLPSASRTVDALRQDELRFAMRSRTRQEEENVSSPRASYWQEVPGAKLWAIGRILCDTMPKRVRAQLREDKEKLRLDRSFADLSEEEREFVSGVLRCDSLMQVSLHILRLFQEGLFDEAGELDKARLLDVVSDGVHQVKVSTARFCYADSVGPQKAELREERQRNRLLKAEFNKCRGHYLREVTYLRNEARARADPESGIDKGTDIAHFYDPTWSLDHNELKFVTEVISEKLKMIFERNPAVQHECDLTKLEQLAERVRGGEVKELKASLKRAKEEREQLKQECLELRTKMVSVSYAVPAEAQAVPPPLPEKYWSEKTREGMLTQLEMKVQSLQAGLWQEQQEHQKESKSLEVFREECQTLQTAYDEEIAERMLLQKRVTELEEMIARWEHKKTVAEGEASNLQRVLGSKGVQAKNLQGTVQRQLTTLQALAAFHRKYVAPDIALGVGDFSFVEFEKGCEIVEEEKVETVFKRRRSTSRSRRETAESLPDQLEGAAAPPHDPGEAAGALERQKPETPIKTSQSSDKPVPVKGSPKTPNAKTMAEKKALLQRPLGQREDDSQLKATGSGVTMRSRAVEDDEAELGAQTWPLAGMASDGSAKRSLDGRRFMDLLEQAESCAVETQERHHELQERYNQLQAECDNLRWLLRRHLDTELQGNAEAQLDEVGNLSNVAAVLGSSPEPAAAAVKNAVPSRGDVATLATTSSSNLSGKGLASGTNGAAVSSCSHGGTGDAAATLSSTCSTALPGGGLASTTSGVATSGGTGDMPSNLVQQLPEDQTYFSASAGSGAAHSSVTGQVDRFASSGQQTVADAGRAAAGEGAGLSATGRTPDVATLAATDGAASQTALNTNGLADGVAREAAEGTTLKAATGSGKVVKNGSSSATSAALGAAASSTSSGKVASDAASFVESTAAEAEDSAELVSEEVQIGRELGRLADSLALGTNMTALSKQVAPDAARTAASVLPEPAASTTRTEKAASHISMSADSDAPRAADDSTAARDALGAAHGIAAIEQSAPGADALTADTALEGVEATTFSRQAESSVSRSIGNTVIGAAPGTALSGQVMSKATSMMPTSKALGAAGVIATTGQVAPAVGSAAATVAHEAVASTAVDGQVTASRFVEGVAAARGSTASSGQAALGESPAFSGADAGKTLGNTAGVPAASANSSHRTLASNASGGYGVEVGPPTNEASGGAAASRASRGAPANRGKSADASRMDEEAESRSLYESVLDISQSPEGLRSSLKRVEDSVGETRKQLHEALQQLDEAKRADAAAGGGTAANAEETVAILQQVERLTKKIKQERFEHSQLEARLEVAKLNETEQAAEFGVLSDSTGVVRKLTPPEELEASRTMRRYLRSFAKSLSKKLEESVTQNVQLVAAFNEVQKEAAVAAQVLEEMPELKGTPKAEKLRASLTKICCASVFDRLHYGDPRVKQLMTARRRRLREEVFRVLFPRLRLDPEFAEADPGEIAQLDSPTNKAEQPKQRPRSLSQPSLPVSVVLNDWLDHAHSAALKASSRDASPEGGSSRGRSPGPTRSAHSEPGLAQAKRQPRPGSAGAGGSPVRQSPPRGTSTSSADKGDGGTSAPNMGASPMSETARETNGHSHPTVTRSSISSGLTEPPSLMQDSMEMGHALTGPGPRQRRKLRPMSAPQETPRSQAERPAGGKLPPLAGAGGQRRPEPAGGVDTMHESALAPLQSSPAKHATSPRNANVTNLSSVTNLPSAPKPPASAPLRVGSRPGSAKLVGQGGPSRPESRQESNSADRPASVTGFHETPLVELPACGLVRRSSGGRQSAGGAVEDAKKAELKHLKSPLPRDTELGLSGKKFSK